MLNQIIGFSIEHRTVVLLLTAVMAVSGLLALATLPIDAFPDTSPVMVQVNTMVPGLVPEEIEMQITYPIEQVISGLPGLTEVRSISKFGLSQVSAIFQDGFDILRARQLVSERIITAELPEQAGMHKPELAPITSGMGEVFHYLLKSDRYDLAQLRTLQHWVIKPHLRLDSRRGRGEQLGGYEKQYHVLFDPARLAKYELTLDDVVAALRANNANVGGGSLSQAGKVQLVQGVGLVTNVAEIADIVVHEHDGQPIRVRDVADVEISHEIPVGAVTTDGQGEVVLGLGFMLLGENSREITQRLRHKIEEVKKLLPPGVEIREAVRPQRPGRQSAGHRPRQSASRRAVGRGGAVRAGGRLAGRADRGRLDSAGHAVCRQSDGPGRNRRQPDEPGGDRFRHPRRQLGDRGRELGPTPVGRRRSARAKKTSFARPAWKSARRRCSAS